MNIVYINGLNSGYGVREPELQMLAEMEQQGITAEAADVNHRQEGSFEAVTDRIEGRVRQLAELGDVAIVGFSAGGSYAMNIFDRVSDLENVSAVSIAGRLAKGDYKNIHPRSLYHAAHLGSTNGPQYHGFNESVWHFENIVEPGLLVAERARLLVIKPKHDQVVPLKTMTIPGVETLTVNANTHQAARKKGLRLVAARLGSRSLAQG